MSQIPSHIASLGVNLNYLKSTKKIELDSAEPSISITELPIMASQAISQNGKLKGLNPINPEAVLKNKKSKPRKMSSAFLAIHEQNAKKIDELLAETSISITEPEQVIMSSNIAEVVAVVAPAPEKIKIQRKSKKMMTEQIPVIPEKIEMDFVQSGEGSVSQQANQMSQEYAEFNLFAEEEVVVPAPAPVPAPKKKLLTLKTKKVSAPLPSVADAVVAEIVQDLVVRAVVESDLKVEVAREKAEKKRLTAEKAKATREANKAKKVAELAQVADSEEEKEEGEELEEGEYERSTAKRPIQKEKEGRVLEGKLVAVEKDIKKEMKILKTTVSEAIGKTEDEEKKREKREELEMKKRQALTKIHHTIAEKFVTSVVVARRSEAGKGEKKNFASKAVVLQDSTVEKLFWANCERVIPHYIPAFTTYSSAKKEYNAVVKMCFADEEDEGFTIEKRAEAYATFRSWFARATEALVADTCDVVQAEQGEHFNPDSMSKRLILATHLSVQGIYVVRRLENSLVLRSSRDELIEMGNANEVMSVGDLVNHRRNKVLSLGGGVLRKLCSAIDAKAKVREE